VNEIFAVLADVHGNLEAMDVVLADAQAHGVASFVVAGDLSGFGGDPDGCLDRLIAVDARMVRGNHEADYVARFGPGMPVEWRTGPRWAGLRWNMERLGATRRRYLADLPDRLELGRRAAVMHASTRGIRAGAMPTMTDDVLEEMFSTEPLRSAFVGHTHRAFDRRLRSGRRIVNAGSVGLPLDEDPRAAYAVVEPRDGDWAIDLRRVAYPIERAIARAWTQAPEVADEVLALFERTGRDYVGPAFRAARDEPDDTFLSVLAACLRA